MPEGRLELPPLTRLDFESSASTIPPLGQLAPRSFMRSGVTSSFYMVFGLSKHQINIILDKVCQRCIVYSEFLPARNVSLRKHKKIKNEKESSPGLQCPQHIFCRSLLCRKFFRCDQPGYRPLPPASEKTGLTDPAAGPALKQ